MDFWCRGRADIAAATAEPAEEVLLADISVRLVIGKGILKKRNSFRFQDVKALHK